MTPPAPHHHSSFGWRGLETEITFGLTNLFWAELLRAFSGPSPVGPSLSLTIHPGHLERGDVQLVAIVGLRACVLPHESLLLCCPHPPQLPRVRPGTLVPKGLPRASALLQAHCSPRPRGPQGASAFRGRGWVVRGRPFTQAIAQAGPSLRPDSSPGNCRPPATFTAQSPLGAIY